MKKNVIYILVLGLASTFCLSSCKKNDWFDAKRDKNLAVPATLKDLQALLDNSGLFNIFCPHSHENASDYHFYNSSALSWLSGFDRNAYIWSKEYPAVSVTDWINGKNSGSYGKIYTANLILESLDKITLNTPQDIQVSNNVKGQALFFRGKTFYELSELFVPPYDESMLDKKFGLALRLSSDVNIKSVRSTVDETFRQIINDLTNSIELLPLTPAFKTRPSKLAAYAMLARVYLSWSNYTEAKKYADLCLGDYSHLIDYNTLDYTSPMNPFQGYNAETIFYSFMTGGTFIPLNIYVDTTFYSVFDDNDLRKQVFFNEVSFNEITYKGTYAGAGFDNFFNGLATDEMLLVRAECEARDGDFVKAMTDLNTLLKARFKSPFGELDASNAEEALEIILRERKKELIFRGTRWSDLRRLNRDPRFATTLTRIVDGKTYKLEPNSYKYTFPIPDDIILATDMEQNPGWN